MPVVHGVRVNARRAIAAALGGVAGAVGAVMLVLSLAGSSDSIEVRLGDGDFRGIDAADLANEIAYHGPVPFPDLLGRDRSIWVTHAGSDPVIGWYAFLARTPKGDRCVAQWDADAVSFVDSCDAGTSYPPDGAGLEQLRWQVVDGELRILINNPGVES